MARKRRLFFNRFQSFLKYKCWCKCQHRLMSLVLALSLALLFSLTVAAQDSRLHSATPLQMLQADDNVNFVEQGRALYEEGQYANAINVLQQALQHYQKQGDRLQQALVLSNLSLSYQQLGLWPEATQRITNALDLLQPEPKVHKSSAQIQMLAQAQDIRARLHLSLGHAQGALDDWVQAAKTYALAKDATGEIRCQINQAQALQVLGNYHLAQEILNTVQKAIATQPDSLVQVVALRSLGEVQLSMGNTTESDKNLQQSLAIARRLKLPSEVGATLLSLGNTTRSQGKLPEALEFYQQAARSPNPTTRGQAQLNQLSLLIDRKQWSEAESQWPQIQSQLMNSPLSRTTAYAWINLSQSLLKLSQQSTYSSSAQIAAQTFLETALQQSQQLGDRQAESYALGTLGELSEQNQQWQKAQDLTQKALTLAQFLNAPDITYRWQGQLGRLLNHQGNTAGAIAAYTEAVDTLQTLRTDLSGANKDLQFSFRDSVEPIYREMVRLLLLPQSNSTPSQANLKTARDTIEALQVAEVENFLQVNCLDTKPVLIDQVTDTSTLASAVIYPIILPDRLDVILKLPQQQNLRHFTSPVDQAELEAVLDRLNQALTQRNSPEVLPLSQKLYNWLIRSAAKELEQRNVQTLVFVLDGPLRNIPMAALHSGQQYLGQQYSIALTPGLQLLKPKPFERERWSTLAAGLTEARPGFAPLDHVNQEFEQVQSQMPTRKLLNQAFTNANLQRAIGTAPFPIVHLATHGQFSSKADQTFILTWDGRINVNRMNEILQARDLSKGREINLLILSACETAAGDSWAALGLAGVAVRAGARSTLATLWRVDDQATATLMGKFYEELRRNTTITKAEALKRAQSVLINEQKYQHPYYWAPYVLVGNWF
jgi:CHAT domain-containing protein